MDSGAQFVIAHVDNFEDQGIVNTVPSGLVTWSPEDVHIDRKF